jgi:subtilisin family serine protease
LTAKFAESIEVPMRRRAGIGLALASALTLTAAPAASSAPQEDRLVMAKLVPFSDDAARSAARHAGAQLEGTLPEIGWAVFTLPGDPAGGRDALRRAPGVFRIDTGTGLAPRPHLTPSDTIFTQPGSVAAGQLTANWNWHWVITNFPAAWDIARGAGMRVAVIDSEFDTEHLELKPKLLTGKNLDSGTSGYGTTAVRANAQDFGTLHGSHVAGIVAAVSDNANGVPGACFDCSVIPYKIGLRGGPPGSTQTTDAKFVRDLTEALVDIAGRDDVRIVNMSLGTDRLHAPMRDAVALALSRGKILVASAGNGQLSNPGVPNYPASFPGVIGVGATQPDDNIAPFSTNGDFVDVSAPGHGIVSTWDTRVPVNAAPPVTPPTHGVGFVNLSGTSMASPMVAGLAALMLEIRPDLTAAEVQQLLEASAVDLGAPGRDPVFGAGRIDAAAALRATRAYVRPRPVDGRRALRVFWSCRSGARVVPPGRPRFVPLPVGTRLVCTGRTQPAVRSRFLQIQRYAVRGGWTTVGRVRTSNRGRFGFTRLLGTTGNWRLRVAYAGDAAVKPGGAPAVRARAVRVG